MVCKNLHFRSQSVSSLLSYSLFASTLEYVMSAASSVTGISSEIMNHCTEQTEVIIVTKSSVNYYSVATSQQKSVGEFCKFGAYCIFQA